MFEMNTEKSTPKNDKSKGEVAKAVKENTDKIAKATGANKIVLNEKTVYDTNEKKADEKKIREQEKALKEKAEKERKDKKDKEAKKMKKKKVEVPGEHGKPFGGNDRASRCS